MTTSLPATNFAVVRVKRDILRRSSIGAELTRRSDRPCRPWLEPGLRRRREPRVLHEPEHQHVLGATRTEGLAGDDQSYRAQLDYSGDRYGVQTEWLRVGDNFNPEIGFVRRDDMKRSFAFLRFSPRPASMPSIRRLIYAGSADYIENGRGWLETRELEGQFGLDFQNSDRFT